MLQRNAAAFCHLQKPSHKLVFSLAISLLCIIRPPRGTPDMPSAFPIWGRYAEAPLIGLRSVCISGRVRETAPPL